MSSNRGHRAGQCAPEVPRTRICARGDLQEGSCYASRCQFPLFPSTKSRFLCAFGIWNPCFREFRVQNRGFCAFLPFGTPILGRFEHKIRVFVLGVPLSAASGRVIADIFEILPGWGRWYNGTLAGKASVMIGWFGDKLLD